MRNFCLTGWNPSGTVLNEVVNLLLGTLCGREKFLNLKNRNYCPTLYILYTLRCWILEFLITAILLE
ncbi:unnamed protein product [Rhizophagus irregularis]|nr:unnamed protein product [Rhizophagus irregularis]